MKFVALDVETANADLSSICQIGFVHYQNGVLADEWCSYIDPEDFFDEINISIHGIDETTVKGAPTLPNIRDRFYQYMDDRICICHTHFDRLAIQQSFEKYEIRKPNCTWLDSARVARRTWKEFAWRGYGLGNICSFLGYEYMAHDALEDAKAAAHVLLTAIDQTGLTIEEWLKRVEQPIQAIKRHANPEGHMYGEVLVFTGALEISRGEAAAMAASVGCNVNSGVTKNTTILVVGDQDIKRLAGQEKSSKHRKAEALIAKGKEIRILQESDFKQLVALVK